jgi:hypothetical protein
MSLKPFVAVPQSDREWQKWLRETYDQRLKFGTGSPEGVVTADIGTLYMRTDGGATTTLYVKTANNGSANGWTAK